MRMNPKDLYRLRRMQLHAQRSQLLAQMSQQRLQEFALELERRYGLLAREATLDARTGEFTLAAEGANDGQGASLKEARHGPADDAN